MVEFDNRIQFLRESSDIREKMQDKSYVRAYREYEKLAGRVERFFETKGDLLIELFEAHQKFYNNSVEGVINENRMAAESIEAEIPIGKRITTPAQIDKLLEGVTEFKVLALGCKYGGDFAIDDLEIKLRDLGKKMKLANLENIPREMKGVTKAPSKSTPVQGSFSIPKGAGYHLTNPGRY